MLSLLFLFVTAWAMEPSNDFRGGLLPDCPGSTKAAFLSKNTLKRLKFLVLTSNSSMIYREYNYFQMEELAKDPDVDFKNKTMLFAGGYGSSPYFPFAANFARAYKNLGYNVFMLNTFDFILVMYPQLARLMRPVGKHTAEMLKELTTKGLDPKRLEVIGMSLGGQTISFIAKSFKSITGVSIGRLIALDPSGPCFRNLGPEDRIDKSDADFLILVATNIVGYGMAKPVGHVNFYVNGGIQQPGGIIPLLCNNFCSHTRSFTLWMSALSNPNKFIAMQCDSLQQAMNKDCFDRVPQVTNLFGPKVDRNKEGIFYLTTGNRPPYYLGKKGLKKESDTTISFLAAFNEIDNLKY